MGLLEDCEVLSFPKNLRSPYKHISQLIYQAMTSREEITDCINKLFVYTDFQQWEKLQREVFTENVHLDMTSLGGEAMDTTAAEICSMWKEGFKDLDAVNHLGGNYLVDLIDGDQAKVFAYATATHYREAAREGQTREFVGSYDLGLSRTERGWRIHRLVYNLKFLTGNVSLE